MTPRQLMRRALQLARRGEGWVEPNPMVGAVLARDGRILAEGYHSRFGGPHAEIMALDDARRNGVAPAGCDLFVSLEPCSHHGKTPPCVDALIETGIGQVWVAMADPFQKVGGKGIERLEAAGAAVKVGLLEDEARALNAPYLKRIHTALPWVLAKWAQSLDGRVATAGGHSQWISSEASRRQVHKLRARVDAIMTGIGTVMTDDPLLTARKVPIRRRARRVIVDPHFKISNDRKLLQAGGSGTIDPPLTIAVRRDVLDQHPTRRSRLEAKGVEFVAIPLKQIGPSRYPLANLMSHLGEHHQATNVLVEGGPKLLGHLMAEGLIDQVLAFVAPKILGDDSARAAVEGLRCDLIENATTMNLVKVRRIGDDLMLDYRFKSK